MKKLLAACSAFCLLASAFASAANTVVWISIDGMRFDTLDLYHPPTLDRLAKEGAFTKDEHPIFPSLTFPNHIAQVTGTTVDHDGVPMNGFFDSATNQKYSFPDDASLIRVEPIWATATRQGVRTLVIDWPMSYKQTGPNAAAYFAQGYDEKETDTHCLNRVLDLVKNDHADKPLRLIITYLPKVDQAEHAHGPGSEQVKAALLSADGEVDHFMQDILAWFNATRAADDELYFLITTDHGMEEVKTQVSLDRLLGGELKKGATITTSGPMGTIALDRAVVTDVPGRVKAIVNKLSADPYLSVWPSDAVPPTDHFADPSRIGDVVVMCGLGYTFTSTRASTSQPAAAPHGMHGYDPEISPNMRGCAIIWRYRHPLGGIDLGRVDNTQWHATVAQLLGIQPAETASPRPINLSPPASQPAR